MIVLEKNYDILDSPPEDEFDNLTRLALEICEIPISLITFLYEARQSYKSAKVLATKETSREISLAIAKVF